MDFSTATDLTFWQLVGVALMALPVIAIVLAASIFVIGFILWWAIKIAFMGAVFMIIIMLFILMGKLTGSF